MSRRAKGARLYLRERRGRESTYVILDRGLEIGTGCGAGELEQAQVALAIHLQKTRLREGGKRDPSQVAIADILAFYLDNRAEHLSRPEMPLYITPLLLAHAGTQMCDQINGAWCRSYVEKRLKGVIAAPPSRFRKAKMVQEGSVRRELEHLNTCLGFAVKEGILAAKPALTYPSAPSARLRFLTRKEVARLLWACWRHRTPDSNFEPHPLRHVARFILMGIYTGTRSGAILTASFAAAAGRSYVDMESGVYHRLADGKRATNKRQPPVRLPGRLLAHMQRWHAQQGKPGHVIAWRGDSVASVKKGFAHAVKIAKLEGQVTPHVLRHTFMTWTLNASVPLFVAAKIAGMSPKAAERVYGHLDSSRKDALDAVFYGRNMGQNTKQEKRKA